ncbi:MAG TPA: DNA-binding domain-containing protein [Candidatus Binataceae bacterium]
MIAPRLRDIQAGFWGAIAGASGIDRDFAAAVAPGPRLDSGGGVAVYAQAYASRLRDVLRKDFPISAKLLGDDPFAELVRDYLLTFPSEHPSVRHLGRAMAEFIDRRRRESPESSRLPPYLPDLARLEWAMNDAFDAPDAASIGVDVLGRIAPERWPELRFTAIPALTLLECRWPVNELCSGAEASGVRPLLTHIRIWRDRDYQVFQAPIDPREAEALKQMIAHAPFAMICEAYGDLPTQEAARQASATLARWLRSDIIARVD